MPLFVLLRVNGPISAQVVCPESAQVQHKNYRTYGKILEVISDAI